MGKVGEYAYKVKGNFVLVLDSELTATVTEAFTLPSNFRLSHIRYYITVEPLGFLLYLGLYCLVTVQPQLQEIRFTASYEVCAQSVHKVHLICRMKSTVKCPTRRSTTSRE